MRAIFDRSALSRVLAAGCILVSLSSCEIAGPMALSKGRPSYNDTIEQTSAEQVLKNIIRVYRDEPIQVLDVSEVDAQLTVTSQLTGGQTGIGAKSGAGASGAVSGASTSGSVGATLGYAEQPTIRYVPLSGQAFVAQLNTPISVGSIASLWGSDWPIFSIFYQAVDNLTPRYEDYYAALDAIADLDQYGALSMVAGKSQLTSKKSSGGGSAGKDTVNVSSKNISVTVANSAPAPNQGGGDAASDSLILFLNPERVDFHPITGRKVGTDYYSDYRLPRGPESHCSGSIVDQQSEAVARLPAEKNVLHLWIRLLRIYQGTQPTGSANPAAAAPSKPKPASQPAHAPSTYPTGVELTALETLIDDSRTDETILREKVIPKLPLRIELRGAPIDPSWTEYRDQAPIFRTRSALGVLKAMVDTQQTIQPLAPADLDKVISLPQNAPDLTNIYKFYTLPLDEKTQDKPVQDSAHWVASSHCYLFTRTIEPAGSDFGYSDSMQETNLASLRKLMLIEQSDQPPKDPYVAVTGSDGKWYSIRHEDKVSKLNFALVHEFMAMQAVASQTPPLTPTISVGGR